MNEAIETKLAAGNWEFEDLPLVRDESALWSRVQEACNLTDQELSRLKNTRCPPLAQAPTATAAPPDDSSMPAVFEALFAEPVLEKSVFVRFQFQQVGGRLQMKQFASDRGFGGYIKRARSQLLICVVVWPLDKNADIVASLVAYIKALPQSHITRRGTGRHYSPYLGKPFEIRKTRPTVMANCVELDDFSEDPDDAVSDAASIVSYSSGTSSYK